MKLSVRLRGTQRPAINIIGALYNAERKIRDFEPKNVDELSRFFEINKDTYHEIWIILTKKKHADPRPVSFDEVVGEAIKHGLIDSRVKSLNERKYSVRFTERKKPKPFSSQEKK